MVEENSLPNTQVPVQPQPFPDILTLVSKEKFRRRMVLLSRLLALVLIVAIFWVGYVQMTYAKDVGKIMGNYGSLGYCYMCGKEAMRKCECQYLPDIQREMDITNLSAIAEQTALYNVQGCPVKDLVSPANLSGMGLNFTNFTTENETEVTNTTNVTKKKVASGGGGGVGDISTVSAVVENQANNTMEMITNKTNKTETENTSNKDIVVGLGVGLNLSIHE